jgi:hypothetical protein
MQTAQHLTDRALANATLFTVLRMATLAAVVMAWASPGLADGFSDAASLANARVFHTATLLPTGKVLVAGGKARAVFSPARSSTIQPAIPGGPAVQ